MPLAVAGFETNTRTRCQIGSPRPTPGRLAEAEFEPETRVRCRCGVRPARPYLLAKPTVNLATVTCSSRAYGSSVSCPRSPTAVLIERVLLTCQGACRPASVRLLRRPLLPNAQVHRARATALNEMIELSCAGSGATASWAPLELWISNRLIVVDCEKFASIRPAQENRYRYDRLPIRRIDDRSP